MWDYGFGKYLYGMVMILSAAGFLFVASRMHGVVGWIAYACFAACVAFVFWMIARYAGAPPEEAGGEH